MKNILTGVPALICGLLAIAAQSLFGAGSGYVAAANTYDAAVDVHKTKRTRTNDAAVSARHLLWKEGTTPGTTVALCGANDIPLGTIDNTESSTGIAQDVLLLGRGMTKKMVASEAMATLGVNVYAAASGKIALNGVVKVGVLRTTAAADGDVVEVEDCVPVVQPNGKATVAGGTLAIPVTRRIASKTTGGAEALTLADGLPGQQLTVILATDGGDGTLTPTTKTGFTSIVFADVGDTAHLLFVDATVGWTIQGLSGAAAPPTFNA
ncbi:hypothetical protein GCM10023213_14090 [Prosthecobacter algae]|uniref:Uncharacterized protein n=2 Tax=Prosthecobacter algae TaxID=1144682 RepID=A0ABP9P5A1_9BACT